jgi:hypothetical protein
LSRARGWPGGYRRRASGWLATLVIVSSAEAAAIPALDRF